MTPAQCRAARALLNMTQDTLAEKSDVSRKTVSDFEKNARNGGHLERTVAWMKQALEEAGVEWVAEKGVSLR